MTRENKLALVIGFGLILFVGVLVSDHFSAAQNQEAAELARADEPLVAPDSSVYGLVTVTERRDEPAVPVAVEPRGQAAPPSVHPASNAVVADASEPAMLNAQPELEVPEGFTVVRNVDLQELPSIINPPEGFIFHDVQRGETLYAISRLYFGDASRVRNLARINGLSDPGDLRVGHRLRIPQAALHAAEAAPSATPARASLGTAERGTTTYTVKPNETLSEIAQRLLGTVRRMPELIEANRDVIEDPDFVPAGTVLKVPSTAPRR